MNIDELRNEVSIRGKNGVGFLLSGLIIWSLITFIFLLPLEVHQKNMYMLFSTGLMFPLAVAISTWIKADWKFEGLPLGSLGLYLNLAQLIYFPILFWAIGKSPNDAVMIFAIITGAHFFPYGWFYRAKAYYIIAPVISILIMVIGWNMGSSSLWWIPLSVVIILFILVCLLLIDYKIKEENHEIKNERVS